MLNKWKKLTVTRIFREGKKIVGYDLKDANKERYNVTSEQLKEMLKSGKIALTNYHLSLDGRIVKGRDYLSVDDDLFKKWYKKWKEEEKPFPFVACIGIRVIPSNSYYEPDSTDEVYDKIYESEIEEDWFIYLEECFYSNSLSSKCTYKDFKSDINRCFSFFIEDYEEERQSEYRE